MITTKQYYFLATSLKVQIIFSVALVSLFLSQRITDIFMALTKQIEPIYKILDSKRLFVAFFVVSAFFFYLLQVDNPIGDKHGSNFGVSFLIPQDEAHGVEFLSIAIPNMVHYVFNHGLGIAITGREAVIGMNTLFGALALIFLLKISRKFFSPFGTLFLLVFLSAGYMEMFFAYWEIYAQAVMFTIIFFYYCFNAISDNKSKLWAAIVLGLSISSHSTLVTLYPGFFLFLWWTGDGSFRQKIKETAKYTAITFGIFISLFLFFYIVGNMQESYLEVYPYSFATIKMALSSSHYLGIFNEYLITGGISLITIIVILLTKGLKKTISSSPVMVLFLGTSISYLIFLMIYIHTFGYFGDWSLMTPGGVITVFFVSWLIKNNCSETEITRMLPLFITTNIFFYIPTFVYDHTYICALVC